MIFSDIDKLYIGNAEVDRAYIGGTLIYGENKPSTKEILYRNEYKAVRNPNVSDGFGANIISNTYNVESDMGTIVFDDDVTAIPQNAFSGMTFLELSLPSTIATIGDSAFYRTYIKNFVLTRSMPPEIQGRYCFDMCAIDNVEFPENANYLSFFFKDLDFTQSEYEINGYSAAYAIEDFASIPYIIYGKPSAVYPHIGIDSYLGKLDIIKRGKSYNFMFFNERLTEIPKNAFENTNFVYPFEIGLPNSVTKIEDYAFQHTNIEAIKANNVAEIGEYSFYDCGALNRVRLPKLSHFHRYSFEDCTGLTEISIAKDAIVENRVFNGCTKLRKIFVYGTSYDNIAELAFDGLGVTTAGTGVSFYVDSRAINLERLTHDIVKYSLGRKTYYTDTEGYDLTIISTGDTTFTLSGIGSTDETAFLYMTLDGYERREVEMDGSTGAFTTTWNEIPRYTKVHLKIDTNDSLDIYYSSAGAVAYTRRIEPVGEDESYIVDYLGDKAYASIWYIVSPVRDNMGYPVMPNPYMWVE